MKFLKTTKSIGYSELDSDMIIDPNRPIWIDKRQVLKILRKPLKNLDLSEDSCDTRYIEEIEKL